MHRRVVVWLEKGRFFRRLAPWERYLLVEVGLGLPLLSVSARALGFQRTWRLLAWFAPVGDWGEITVATQEKAVQIAGLVAAAGRNLPFRASCLQDSLALWWVLRRYGIPGTLRIGVRKGDEAGGGDPRDAHAWVEVDGVVLNDYPDVAARYAVFAPALEGLVIGVGGEH